MLINGLGTWLQQANQEPIYTNVCVKKRVAIELFGLAPSPHLSKHYTQNNFRNSAPVQLPHSERRRELARKFRELMLVVLRTAAGSIPWPVIYKLNKGEPARDKPSPSWQ